jgi:hypothetical protein
MDPWLEHPDLWLGVHNRLITAVADEIVPKVAPKHFVDVEQSAYLVSIEKEVVIGRPDVLVSRTKSRKPVPRLVERKTSAEVGAVELDVQGPVKDRVEEWYLEVRQVGTRKLVTVIEILSPTNKSNRGGRKKYIKKRNRILESSTSLVEIDLLRGGKPMPLLVAQPVESDYRILISRGASRPNAKLYAFGVRQPIPVIPIPLLPNDPEPKLDLNAVLHALYHRARFDLMLDYTKPAVPRLREDDSAWARALIRPNGR